MTKLNLIKLFFLLTIVCECMCCSRSKRHIQKDNDKLTPLHSQLVNVNEAKNISADDDQPTRLLCDDSVDDIYCYNDGKCYVEFIKFNETYKLRITYCECAKGFSGKACRDDDRFMEANLSIIIFVSILSVVLIVVLIGGLFYRCHRRKLASLKNTNQPNDQNTELLPKSTNAASTAPGPSPTFMTHEKKKVNREISSVSEKLGTLVETKNKTHNERLKISESQLINEQDDEHIKL